MSTQIPNPGSKEAIDLGCECAIDDNNYGTGRGDGTFWITEGCPVHAPKPPQQEQERDEVKGEV